MVILVTRRGYRENSQDQCDCSEIFLYTAGTPEQSNYGSLERRSTVAGVVEHNRFQPRPWPSLNPSPSAFGGRRRADHSYWSIGERVHRASPVFHMYVAAPFGSPNINTSCVVDFVSSLARAHSRRRRHNLRPV